MSLRQQPGLVRSLRRTARKLGFYAVRRLRQLRPRVAPPAASAVRDALVRDGTTVPASDGSRYYQRLPVRIGIVTDEFLYNALRDAAELLVVTPDNYRSLEVDLFLFVACSNGMGHWPKLNVARSPSRAALHQVIDSFDGRGVPTVFWSIEDPPHYDDFLSVAQRCRHVHTTTVEKVDDYRRDCARAARVGVLPFGVNPLLHNPVGGAASGQRPALFFAGTWYRQYPEREIDMGNMFDGALAAGRELVLIDRCYLRGNPSFDFPRTYRRFTYPPIEHGPLQSVQKLFDWCLNFNSVKHSATMFANRVPELQAQGRAVLSNYSRSLDRMYPHVFTVTDAAQVGPILAALSADELHEHQMLGVRAVMEGQTYFEKVAQVCADVGLPVTLPRRSVLVVADQLTDRVRDTFASQVLSEDRTLVAAAELTPALYASHDFLAWWPAEPAFGPFHLQDQVHAFKYTHAAWVACGEPAHRFTRSLPDKRGAMFATSAFAFADLTDEPRGPLDGGYLVPALTAPPARQAAREPARLTLVVAHEGQAARVWCKHVLPARAARGAPVVDVLVLDDGSTAPADRAWRQRMQAEPGVRVAQLPAGPGSLRARAWRAALDLVTTPYLLLVDADASLAFGALARLAPVLAEDHDVIQVGTIELALPAVRSQRQPERVTVVRTTGTALLPASGGEPPALSTLIVSRTLGAADLPNGPDHPDFIASLLHRARSVVHAPVPLVGRYRPAAPSPPRP